MRRSTPRSTQLAEASGDTAPSRADEPYRRALSGIYARLAATHHDADRQAGAAPRARSHGRALCRSAELPRRSGRRSRAALRDGGGGALATGGALGRLIRAVETFGFHLATLDLRQNSAVHERVVAELLKVAGRRGGLSGARRIRARRAAAPRTGERAAAGQPVRRPIRTRPTSELAIVRAAAEAHASYGPACITNYIVSMAQSVSDLLEVNVLLKEVGLYRAGRAAARAAIMAVPLFETIGDLEAAPGDHDRMVRAARGRAR